MTYKILQEKRKSVTSPPRNSERSKEPIAEDKDVVEDEKQVQKEIFQNIPAPSSLYSICMLLHSQDKELEELIEDLKCLSREEDGVIRRFEASGQLDYSNNPMLFQGTAMQDREANRKLLLEDLRELSAGFRQKQDEAFRRFKSKASGSEYARNNENQLTSMDGSMEEEVVITTEGGLIEIQDTGVSLEIPPGALVEEQLIKMRIVLDDYQDELYRSFGSNSSVVVELLPSNLKLQKPAKLTLPHCLVLKKGCEWKAKIYTSHHEEGNQPLWKEDLVASSELHQSYCMIWLQCFCWKKFVVGDNIVEALMIWLYAARRASSPTSDAYVDVGFYLDLPHGQEAANVTAENILHKQQTSFYKEGGLPLKILFDKDSPSIWTSPTLPNPKEIAFQRVATSSSCHSTFVLKEQTNLEITDYSCYFRAGQGTDLIDLIFPLQKRHLSSSQFVSSSNSDVKIANNKRPPAAEETTETSCSAETTTIPSNLCSTHLSISRGELTSGPPSDFPATSTCYKCIAVLKYVALHIANKWKDLGRHLGVKEPHLTIIKTNDTNDCEEQSFQMLKKWIEENGSGAKYMVLGKALKDAGRLDLQQYVLVELKLQE